MVNMSDDLHQLAVAVAGGLTQQKLTSDTGCTGLPYGSVETGEIRDLTGAWLNGHPSMEP